MITYPCLGQVITYDVQDSRRERSHSDHQIPGELTFKSTSLSLSESQLLRSCLFCSISEVLQGILQENAGEFVFYNALTKNILFGAIFVPP